jgi:hypothetical protein
MIDEDGWPQTPPPCCGLVAGTIVTDEPFLNYLTSPFLFFWQCSCRSLTQLDSAQTDMLLCHYCVVCRSLTGAGSKEAKH